MIHIHDSKTRAGWGCVLTTVRTVGDKVQATVVSKASDLHTATQHKGTSSNKCRSVRSDTIVKKHKSLQKS